MSVSIFLFCNAELIKDFNKPLDQGVNSITYWKNYTLTDNEKEIVKRVSARYETYYNDLQSPETDDRVPHYRRYSHNLSSSQIKRISKEEQVAFRYLIANGTPFEKAYAMLELAHCTWTEPYFLFASYLGDSTNAVEEIEYISTQRMARKRKIRGRVKRSLHYYAQKALHTSIWSFPYGDSKVVRSFFDNWYKENRQMMSSYDRLSRYFTSVSDSVVSDVLNEVYEKNPSLYVALLLQDDEVYRRNIHPVSLVLCRIQESPNLKSELFDIAYKSPRVKSWGRYETNYSGILRMRKFIHDYSETIYKDSPQKFYDCWLEQLDKGRVDSLLLERVIALNPVIESEIRLKTAKADMSEKYLTLLINKDLDNNEAWDYILERFNTSYKGRFIRAAKDDSIKALVDAGKGNRFDSLRVTPRWKRQRSLNMSTAAQILKEIGDSKSSLKEERVLTILKANDISAMTSEEVYGVLVTIQEDGVPVNNIDVFKKLHERPKKGGKRRMHLEAADSLLPSALLHITIWSKCRW